MKSVAIEWAVLFKCSIRSLDKEAIHKLYSLSLLEEMENIFYVIYSQLLCLYDNIIDN